MNRKFSNLIKTLKRIPAIVPFDFTPRPPGRSYAARGGLKEWPDEWRCRTCCWCGTKNPDAKRIWCRKWYCGQSGRNAQTSRRVYLGRLD